MLFVIAPVEGRERFRARDHDDADPVNVMTTGRSFGVSATQPRKRFETGDRVVVVDRPNVRADTLDQLERWLFDAERRGVAVRVRDVAAIENDRQ